MRLPPQLQCINHALPLVAKSYSSELVCTKGCRIPVVRSIPRFVDSVNYAEGFGLQWNRFKKTQLDSYTGTTISRDRLERCLGGSLDSVHNKSVLEAGCGAGRFTELLLDAGADVFACDLSTAVEANYANHGKRQKYFVCQANLLNLPVKPRSFDCVICLGVVQHTPNPERTITTLTRYLKPGGILVIDHYAENYPANLSRRVLRKLLLPLGASASYRITLGLVHTMLPLHRLSWSNKRGRWRLRTFLQKHSPVVDYYDLYPQLNRDLLAQWAMLDTHDSITDHYKHLRNAEQIKVCLTECGLTNVNVSNGGNGVEACATVPLIEEPTSNARGGFAL